MKTIITMIQISFCALLLIACSGNPPGIQSEIEADTWVLTSYNSQQPVPERQPILQFEGGEASGTTGCNHYGGRYQINGNDINIDGIYSTEMACMEPEGLMQQEQAYLELLMAATRLEVAGDELTIFVEEHPALVFAAQSNNPVIPTHTSVPPSPIPSPTTTATQEVIEPAQTPTPQPAAGFKEYRDPIAGISIYIPEEWTITGVIEGQYAIFQSYPEDKYVGGEARRPGDAKCDLNIRPPGSSASDLIRQWESNSLTTIVSEEEITLNSGLVGRRFVLESMGQSDSLVAEINNRAVVLTCFGGPEQFEEIARTMSGFDVEATSPIYEDTEGFQHYQDAAAGVAIDLPAGWVATGIVPGERATLQSYPENKYIGGEARDPGDTKCDLFFRKDVSLDEFIHQMESNEAVTILSKDETTLNSGQPAVRITIESLGQSLMTSAEINEQVVVLTCYGDFSLVDAIAVTLRAGE